MNIVFYSTNDLPVGQRVDDGYISLTDMAKSQRKRLDNWLRLKETASLLREFKQSLEYEGLEPVITIEGRNGGTWGHPDIAIQFAQWCSPKFALQVSRWVREWLTTKQNPLNTTQQISSARQRLIEAHILRTQALNRTIHTAIHQQTDAIRDTLNTLDSRIQSQTVVIQTVDTNSNSHKLKQLLPKSSSGIRRPKGSGSGSIHWRTTTINGKNYQQPYYHYEFRSNGDRLIKSSKYIPKRLISQVQRLEEEKAPVLEVLKVLGVGL